MAKIKDKYPDLANSPFGGLDEEEAVNVLPEADLSGWTPGDRAKQTEQIRAAVLKGVAEKHKPKPAPKVQDSGPLVLHPPVQEGGITADPPQMISGDLRREPDMTPEKLALHEFVRKQVERANTYALSDAWGRDKLDAAQAPASAADKGDSPDDAAQAPADSGGPSVDLTMGPLRLTQNDPPAQPQRTPPAQQTPEDRASMEAAVQRARDMKHMDFSVGPIEMSSADEKAPQAPPAPAQAAAQDPRSLAMPPQESDNRPPPMPAPEPAAGSRPPADNSAMLALLKGVQDNAYAANGMESPKGGYYETMLGAEATKQKNYQEQVKEMLKQKFEGDQKGMDRALDVRKLTEAERGHAASEAQNVLKEKELTDWRKKQDENTDLSREEMIRRDKAMEAMARQKQAGVDIRINGIDQRQANQLAAHAKFPDAGEIKNLNDVLATIESGKAPGTGFFMNEQGYQNFLRSRAGVNFMHAVLGVVNPELHSFGGSALTALEASRKLGEFGYGSFDSPDSLADGMNRLAMEKAAVQAQTVSQLPLAAQQMLREQGAILPIGAKHGRVINDNLGPSVQGQVNSPVVGAAGNIASEAGKAASGGLLQGLRSRAASMLAPSPASAPPPEAPPPAVPPGAPLPGGGGGASGVGGMIKEMLPALLAGATPQGNQAQANQKSNPEQMLAQFLQKKYGQVPRDAQQPDRKAIYKKQLMDDPEFRAKVRKENNID